MNGGDLERGLASLRKRETGLRIVLGLYLACTTAALFLWGTVIGQGLDQNGNQPLVLAAGVSGGLYAILFVASIVAVCLWVHRAHANLFAAGVQNLTFKPNLAVGWYFVPFAFWFKPFQAMQELWKASHQGEEDPSRRGGRKLILWWACWIIGNMIANVSLKRGDWASPITTLDLAGYAFHIVAAAALLLITSAITQAQSSEMSVRHAFA